MLTARERNSVTRTGDAKNIAIEDYSRQRKLFKRPSSVTTRAKNYARTGNIFASKSRGYIKLASASRAFDFNFRNKTVLDIGSSTGGFTEYALEQDAKKVIAVEKGTNQMLSHLRENPRVELHEKTNIFDIRIRVGVVGDVFFKNNLQLDRSEKYISDATEKAARRVSFSGSPEHDIEDGLAGPEKDMSDRTLMPDIILADVSFVSLRKILAHARKYLAGNQTEFLVMLKPQFEAKPEQLTNGIVKNEKIRREIIKNFETWLKQNGFLILKKRDNELKGKTGNKERFYYLKLAK